MSGYLIVMGSSVSRPVTNSEVLAATAAGLIGVHDCAKPPCAVPTLVGLSFDVSKLRYSNAGSSSIMPIEMLHIYRYSSPSQADSFLANAGAAWVSDKAVLAVDD